MSRSDFIGTWSLESYHADTADGARVYPLGEDLAGRITYDADGRMAVQIMRRERERFSTDDPLGAPAEEARAAFVGFIGYYGSYTVDGEGGTVTHSLEVSSIPNWVGSQQVRFFDIDGDHLTLRTPPMLIGGLEVTNVLRWRRA